MPKYHETFLPILQVLSDGKLWHYNDLRKRVRDQFYSDLPEELLTRMTKSGDPLLLNRIGWAKAYLKQGEFVSQPERAMVQITEKGRKALAAGRLSITELLHDEDFLKNRHSRKAESSAVAEAEDGNDSPEDLIDTGITSLENQVKDDLLEKLRAVDPYFFERIVGQLFSKMGYGDFTVTAKSGDGGIDGIINQDSLGFEKIFIQAKRYAQDNKVREPLIREFIGAMSRGTKKGIFVTTSSFDDSAIAKAKDADHAIKLIDGAVLVDLMYRYDIGVQPKTMYTAKQLDEDFFDDDIG